MERVLMLALVAATWPLWAPFLRKVIDEIKVVYDLDDPEKRRAQGGKGLRTPTGRHQRYVNSAWDDMHLGRRGHTHVERRGGDGFVSR